MTFSGTMPRRAAATLLGALVLALPTAAVAAPDVKVDFDDVPAARTIATTGNHGTAVTRLRVVTAGGGRLVARRSPRTGGRAAELPTYDGSADGPRAVLAVRNAGSGDQLEPRARRFAFGADVLLDAVNHGSAYDNGNNVVQRGLHSDRAQLKLQVDDTVPTCRIAGADGELTVRARVALVPGTWSRVRCLRIKGGGGDRVQIRVSRIPGDPSTTSVATSALGHLGVLDFRRRVPLTVGGKLGADLAIQRASDQFNGRIDNAMLRMP